MKTDITSRWRTTEDDITAEVLRRFDSMSNDRLRRIMLSLIQHLHHFVKDVELTEAELYEGIRFLTDTGHRSTDVRQEFILLSDTLGVSMVVDLINHRKPEGATESTIVGRFHREGAPELPPGGNMAPQDTKGTPTIISGHVLDLQGRPIAQALLDVWQADSSGLYDSQYADTRQVHLRWKYRTDKQGRYLVRTIRPVAYQIPADGPVGKMLEATDRHPWRPAHIHFVVSAAGYEPVTTHLFDSVDRHLDSDTVFAVKESLICQFVEHGTRDEAAKRFGIEPPFCTVAFDFVLKPLTAAEGKH